MEILSLNKELEPLYKDFFENRNGYLLYYSLKYKTFIEKLLSCESDYKLAVENDTVIGVLPLMACNGPWGKVYNSLPFYGSHGGIIADSNKVKTKLWEELNNIATNKNVASLTVITHPFHQHEVPDFSFNYTETRIGQWTKLPNYENDIENKLMSTFEPSARRNIRRAIKSDVAIEINCAEWESLKNIHQQNMELIGGLAKTDEFFNVAEKHFKKNKDYKIYIAKKGKKITAALLLFYCGNTVEYFIPAIVDGERQNQPLSLLIYKALLDAISDGYQWWNWGGTWESQDGVYKFKKKWGSENKPYKYYTALNSSAILKNTPEEIASNYPNFYVLPFSKLENQNDR